MLNTVAVLKPMPRIAMNTPKPTAVVTATAGKAE